jgi:ATP-dependent Clp protease ATP-binding subunit ClpA
LLDEVDKADHPSVLNLMLQLFDGGSATPGDIANFRHAVVLMTANLRGD